VALGGVVVGCQRFGCPGCLFTRKWRQQGPLER
jgi:hypothetical protein